MIYTKKILAGVALLALTITNCIAQTNTKGNIVQAKVWSKDESKQVHYSDWKTYNAITVEQIAGFQSAKKNKLDKFGGNAGATYKATGYFRTEKINDRWWVIDPAGHPIVITAVNSIRLGKSGNNELASGTKFGTTENWITSTVNTLQQIGFNTAGSWSDTSAIIGYNKKATSPLAYTTQLNLLSGYANAAKKADKSKKGNSVLSFILEDGFALYCDLQAKNIESIGNDPNLLGHFSDNELPFTHSEFKDILSIEDKTNKVYLAAVEWMKNQGIDESSISKEQKETFLGWLAGKYYETVSKAIKKHDHNHLYIGSRLHSSAKNNEAILKAATPFVDIFSINYYGEWEPKAEHISKWSTWTDKPFFITEFYTKAEETGMSNLSGAGWIVKTQNDRGMHYQNFCIKLLQSKNCVGWHWFRYQDNDPNDKNADESNKDSNKGIVNTNYEVYNALAEKMKEVNDNKYSLIEFFDAKK